MLKCTIVFCCSLVLGCGCQTTSSETVDPCVNAVRGLHSENLSVLEQRYPALEIEAVGGEVFDGIGWLQYGLVSDDSMDIDQARRLIVAITVDVLAVSNQYEPARPYYLTYPLTPNQLRITVRSQPIPEKSGSSGLIFALMANGNISYCERSSTVPHCKERHRESFEEALEIVRQEQQESD